MSEQETKEFTVLITKDSEGNFWGYVAELIEIVVQSDAVESLLEQIAEKIKEYFFGKDDTDGEKMKAVSLRQREFVEVRKLTVSKE